MASIKAAASKKTPTTSKPKSHPAYAERTGSSQYAIAKHIEDNQKDLPANFKKLLLVQLKRLVAAGILIKVKSSFKLGSVEKKVTEKKAPTAAKKVVAKKALAAKKAAAPKAKSGAQVKSKPKKPVKAKKDVKKAIPAKKPKSIKSPTKKAKK
ncbi:hypothetical protein L2E82_03905 [Cichorium intybus]|uniref:Uncharacterized protein n=1 Tax=Cichorium intybus TaxID=13427 RepID=A0ACB9H5U9_CICIN|nr:hypothetical protein L2E82_03905 [Cichorium intybus]